jgi:hypothetical protein
MIIIELEDRVRMALLISGIVILAFEVANMGGILHGGEKLFLIDAIGIGGDAAWRADTGVDSQSTILLTISGLLFYLYFVSSEEDLDWEALLGDDDDDEEEGATYRVGFIADAKARVRIGRESADESLHREVQGMVARIRKVVEADVTKAVEVGRRQGLDEVEVRLLWERKLLSDFAELNRRLRNHTPPMKTLSIEVIALEVLDSGGAGDARLVESSFFQIRRTSRLQSWTGIYLDLWDYSHYKEAEAISIRILKEFQDWVLCAEYDYPSIESVKAHHALSEEEIRGSYFCEGRLMDWSPNEHSALLDEYSSRGSLFTIAF